MRVNRRAANIVILASSFNPTIVTKDWLRERGIINEDPKDFVNVPPFSLYRSENFQLVVEQGKYTLSALNPSEETVSALPEMTKLFIDLLPETPYRAVGFNFEWEIEKEEHKQEDVIASVVDKILTSAREPLYEITSESADFGFKVIWKEDPFLVTMNVDPNLRTRTSISVRFNYHRDLGGGASERVARLKEALNLFKDKVHESGEICEKLKAFLGRTG